MSIWDKMNDLTKGKTKELKESLERSQTAKHGDIIEGTINNIVIGGDSQKGGYGFISSPQLPFERIFFHWSGLRQDTLRFPDLRKRMQVSFQLQHNETDGFRGIKIKVKE